MTNKPIDASVISQTSLPEEVQQGLPVETVGKSEDIRSRRGLTRVSHQTPAGVDAEGWKAAKIRTNTISFSRVNPPHLVSKQKESRVCFNRHGMVRKYGLMMCRQCFRERANQIGFVKAPRLSIETVPISLKVFYADDATFEQAVTRCDGMAPVDGSTACVNP
ncbi:ribosomal protein RPS29 [Toxoplasma gondii p89]|uniref:Ribosomal protein RPS29 n=1 Tax=Toxoplasma gondii p89 TaxID=943119 RepID=A0A086JA17_TOXGO|nr:ribosomal protein RPS29 [Toxoplasma gondii p89]